jgi:hypothetical protein
MVISLLLYSKSTVIKTKGSYGSDGQNEREIWEIRTNFGTFGTTRCIWEDIIKVNSTEKEEQGINRVKMKFYRGKYWNSPVGGVWLLKTTACKRLLLTEKWITVFRYTVVNWRFSKSADKTRSSLLQFTHTLTTLLAVILNVASISTVLSWTMTMQIQNKLRAGFPNSGYNSRNVNYKTRHIHISQVSNGTK